MALLSRQQATQNWHEADPKVHFTDLLDALEMYKDIATEYGLNDTLIQHMRGGSLVTPTRKMVRLIDMTMTSKSSKAKRYHPAPVANSVSMAGKSGP